MSKKRFNPHPARMEPSLEQWAALYEVAGNLKKLAPWRALSDMDILVLQLPGQAEPVYCSVMGAGGYELWHRGLSRKRGPCAAQSDH